MNLALFGPPGAGKGVQAERLAPLLQIPHISSGELFRALATQDTPLARQIHGYIDRGEYVPDELVVNLVLNRLRQPDAKPGFILDGFPRTIPQAKALDRWLAEQGRPLDLVLDIAVPEDILVERIAGRRTQEHRADDLPDVIRTRLRNYHEQTEPLIDYYKQQGKLVDIDGSRDIPSVNTEVDEALAAGARTPGERP